MKTILLFLALTLVYGNIHNPKETRTAVIYQPNVADTLDPSRPRIA